MNLLNCRITACLLLLATTFSVHAADSRIIVEQKDHKFSELFLKIKNDDVLRFVNLDTVNHKLEFTHKGQHEVMNEIEPGSSQEITFSQAGIYDVHCKNHPEMSMTIFIPHVVNLTKTDLTDTF